LLSFLDKTVMFLHARPPISHVSAEIYLSTSFRKQKLRKMSDEKVAAAKAEV
jgi:hypothetical protein